MLIKPKRLVFLSCGQLTLRCKMQFKIQILTRIPLETPGEVELETGSSTDDFAADGNVVPLLDFNLV